MWMTKSCLLPAWYLASVIVADAFPSVVPKSQVITRTKAKEIQVQKQKQKQKQKQICGTCINNGKIRSVRTQTQTQTTTHLKLGATSIEEIPRGGGLADENENTNATETVNANNVKDKPPALPTLADYRKFAIPCLGLWVAQSLLSLVDTCFIGLSAGDESATQLAALGPATTFFDGSTYLFAFLNVATTNLYSSSRAQFGEASDQAEAVVRTASRVALRCGIGIMLFLWAFARPLLALYIGDGTNGVILDSAVEYVKIRAFSLPTSLLLGVVQSALLGAKDSVTPLIAVWYSTVVNVVGDFLLVKIFRMGLRGASIATLLAQLSATAALLGPARNRLVRDHSFGLWKKKVIANANGDEASSSGVVSGKQFLGFAAPVLTLILGKLAAFGFMTNSAAGVPGQPTSLACHQIMLSLYFFVSPFMEVISQTAQTFIPPYTAPVIDYINEKKISNPSTDPVIKPWLEATSKIGTSLSKIGFVVAIFISCLVSMVPAYFGGILTSDSVVKQSVKPLAKYLWTAAFLTAPVAVSEGILLARRELSFLGGVYVLTTLLLPPALLKVKNVGGVQEVWACFAAFQMCRATFFVGRIWLPSIFKAIANLLARRSSEKCVRDY